MSNYFNDSFEDEDDDYFERNIKIWNATDLEKYFMISFDDLSEEDKTEIYLYLIDKYYPGSKDLSNDELIRQKNILLYTHFNLQLV